MGITIRQAEKKDIMQMSEIVTEDWKIAYRGIIDDDYLDSLTVEKRYQKAIDRYQECIVAADNDIVLGYAWIQNIDTEMADCEVIALYVKISHWKNGIGKLLIKSAINHFKNLGKKKMIVWCLKENHEARKFYKKTGGKESETSTHKWGDKDYDIISYIYDLSEM